MFICIIHIKITNYIFSRKLVCGYCGENINGSSGTNKDGVRRYYYRCEGKRKNPSNCPKTALPKDLFDRFTIHKIIGELNKPEVMNKLIDRLLDDLNNKTKDSEQLQLFKQEQRQAKASLKNITKIIEQGITSQTIISRVKELTEQIATLKKNISTERNKPKTMFTREQLYNYYIEKLQRNGREIAALLVNKIRLYNDKIEIIFNSPIKKNPDNGQSPFYVTCFDNPFFNKDVVKQQTIKYFV